MKISNNNPTENILVSLMDYRVDHYGDCESNYGFGCFRYTDRLVSELNKFLDNWEKGIRNTEGILISIPDFILIRSDYIFKQAEQENSNFDGVKLDSLNFLERKKRLNIKTSKIGKGYLLANNKGFVIQGEDIDTNGVSLTIYRSAKISYWKINHLLNRNQPI